MKGEILLQNLQDPRKQIFKAIQKEKQKRKCLSFLASVCIIILHLSWIGLLIKVSPSISSIYTS